jgi:hypothetical protein
MNRTILVNKVNINASVGPIKRLNGMEWDGMGWNGMMVHQKDSLYIEHAFHRGCGDPSGFGKTTEILCSVAFP